jgi:signal transduction histidine kinase
MRFSGNIGFEGETFGSVNLSWDPSNYWQNIDRQIWLARALGMGTALTLSLCFYLWTLILVLRPVEYIHRRLLALRETGVPSQLTAQRFRTRELGALCQLVDQLGSSMSDSNSHNEALSSAHAAKEEALAQMKSNFAANVSHELRTPLNGVLGMLQLLKDANLTVEEREFVDIATRSGRSLLTLIGDVLDFSKSESGMLMLEELNFDLHALLKRTVSPFQSLAADKGLSLHLVVAADVPRFVRGDPTRLGQVIGNLLSNAIKFTNRGHVELRAGRANDGDDVTSLQFEVEDTGIGLTEAAQERVFQPFTQADASTTRKYGGTGLGLSICWQLVSQMGGEISLRSQHHHGSTFAFTIALRMRIGVVPNAVPRWSERATKPPGRAATRSWWSTTVQ